jgi:putative tryptophan/tyrosine transport system substrate-binding protein
MRRRDLAKVFAGAAVWPIAARAQQPAMPVVGYLSTGSPEADATPFLAPFRSGLGQMSFVEGKNVVIEYRWVNFRYERLSAMAAELAQRSVAVIAAVGGTPTGLAAKAATSTVPIVFYVGVDPVKFGLVASLNHPGGNVTGVVGAPAELIAKRMQFLHELVPKATVAAMLANPDNPYTEPEASAVQDAAHSLGLGELKILQASSVSEIDAVFQRLPELHVDALIVSADFFLLSQHKQIVAAAAQQNLPAMYPWREYVSAGGMVSYGPNVS